MHLARLRADHFRLLQPLDIEPHPKLNLIVGDNAAGKSSIIEAVHCLTRGRSFRTSSPPDLARHGADQWEVLGSFNNADLMDEVAVGWNRTKGLRYQRNRQDISLVELVREHPSQLIEPDLHRLVQDGPSERRAYLDWGLFHVEPSFLPNWRKARRALRQRNSAIARGLSDAEITAWDAELGEAGEQIHRLRTILLQQLEPYFRDTAERFLGMGVRWELKPGWNESQAYSEVLAATLKRDRQRGNTMEGPHRAELLLLAQDKTASRHLSRGQEKLLVTALVLAQAKLVDAQEGRAPLLLLDDFSAELAEPYRARLQAALADYSGQCFVTNFEYPKNSHYHAVFHVEHGAVRRW